MATTPERKNKWNIVIFFLFYGHHTEFDEIFNQSSQIELLYLLVQLYCSMMKKR